MANSGSNPNIDLAFLMDCTASMGSHITHAKEVTLQSFFYTL
jgi:hypothetical protein